MLYRSLKLLLVATCCTPAYSVAAPVTFTVDPARSTLSITPSTSLFATTLAAEPQGPGSFSTSYSGQIVAELTDSTIQFLPTSLLIAGSSGLWRPGNDFSGYPDDLEDPDGYVNSAEPANYGILTDLSPQGTVLGQNGWSASAIRDLQIGLSDSSSRTLIGGSFSEVGILTNFASGTVYYASGGTPPITNLATTTTPGPTVDVDGVSGQLITVGNIQALSLPIDFTVTYNVNFLTLSTRYTGTIVATAIVPEPSSSGLLAVAGSCIWLLRRRIKR